MCGSATKRRGRSTTRATTAATPTARPDAITASTLAETSARRRRTSPASASKTTPAMNSGSESCAYARAASSQPSWCWANRLALSARRTSGDIRPRLVAPCERFVKSGLATVLVEVRAPRLLAFAVALALQAQADEHVGEHDHPGHADQEHARALRRLAAEHDQHHPGERRGHRQHEPDPEQPSHFSSNTSSSGSRVSFTVWPSTATTVSKAVFSAVGMIQMPSSCWARKSLKAASDGSPALSCRYSARRRKSFGRMTASSVSVASDSTVTPLCVRSSAKTPALAFRAVPATLACSLRRST